MRTLYRTYKLFRRVSPDFKGRFNTFLAYLWCEYFVPNVDVFLLPVRENLLIEDIAYIIVKKDKIRREVEILDVFVLPIFRLRGYATDGIRMVMQAYETEGFLRVNVIIREDDTRARSLFYNLGFEMDQARTNKLLLEDIGTEKPNEGHWSGSISFPQKIAYYTLLN